MVVLLLSLLVTFVVIAGRLTWLQTAEAGEYAKRAEQQRTQEIVLTPRRGAILDREGQPLAISADAKTVFATRQSVTDPKATSALFAKYLGGDQSKYLAKLSKKRGFVYIERKVPMDRAVPLQKALAAAKIQGVGFADDSRRVYPCGDLACQVLGFVGVDDHGLAGLENYYNDVLGGKPGLQLAERDAFGNPIPGGVQVAEDPVDGRDIMLSIDKDIQYQTQLQLAATVQKYGAKSGSVVIMDPRSGEIYAMASTPTFDPNDYGHATSVAVRNRPIVDAFEPGSTVKAMTASAVVDQKLYTPSSVFHLPPTITVGGRVIHEAHERGPVDWTLAEIVTKSSNIGAVKLGKALGPRRLAQYFGRFGMLGKTGVDFPGEAKGWMPPVDTWSSSTIGNVPFGQGVSVTALQLARAVGAIANQGNLVTPHFLKTVRGDASVKMSWPTTGAISTRTAGIMTSVLSDVVADGTGKAAAVPGYQVAGKTGTAQKPIIGGHGYAAGKYVASFVGFLPSEDPRVLIVVTIDEPSGVIYGGSVAAPLFSALAAYTVEHLKIPPPVRAPGSTEDTAAPASTRTSPAAAGMAPTTSEEPKATGPGTLSKRKKKAGSSVVTTAPAVPRNGTSTGQGGAGPP